MLKRLLVMLVLVGVLFGGILYLKLQSMQQDPAMTGGPPPAVVAAEEVTAESWQPRLRAAGSLVANQGIFVTNEVPGQVREILFESGTVVSRGDPLLQLDDSVDRADLRGLIAERNLAEIKLQRIGKLLRERSVSQSDHDEAKAELDSSEARVASKEALIRKKRITAPFSGNLGIRNVDLGEYLPPGSQIVPLDALEPIYVDYSLPERHLPELRLKQPVVVQVGAYPDRRFEGEISAINAGIERATRSIRVRAILENPERLLRPGMFAQVETLLPARTSVLTVARTAITYNPYGDSVFLVVKREGVANVEQRQVVTGSTQAGRVEIVEGLQAGDSVVVAGQVKLRSGQQVTIDNSIVPATAP